MILGQLTNAAGRETVVVEGCQDDQNRYGMINPSAMNLNGRWHEPYTLLLTNWAYEPVILVEGESRRSVIRWTITFAINPDGWDKLTDENGSQAYRAWDH